MTNLTNYYHSVVIAFILGGSPSTLFAQTRSFDEIFQDNKRWMKESSGAPTLRKIVYECQIDKDGKPENPKIVSSTMSSEEQTSVEKLATRALAQSRFENESGQTRNITVVKLRGTLKDGLRFRNPHLASSKMASSEGAALYPYTEFLAGGESYDYTELRGADSPVKTLGPIKGGGMLMEFPKNKTFEVVGILHGEILLSIQTRQVRDTGRSSASPPKKKVSAK